MTGYCHFLECVKTGHQWRTGFLAKIQDHGHRLTIDCFHYHDSYSSRYYFKIKFHNKKKKRFLFQ